MEPQDEELIALLSDQDPELKELFEAHRNFERQIEEFNRRPYLSTEEALERKRLQKLKLAGKDRIEVILAQHRQGQ